MSFVLLLAWFIEPNEKKIIVIMVVLLVLLLLLLLFSWKKTEPPRDLTRGSDTFADDIVWQED